MKRILIVLSTGLFIFTAAGAQNKGSLITGRITDNEGNPLPGAGISVAGSLSGVLSDKDGYYMLTGLKDGHYTLNISFLGYENYTRETDLRGKAVLDVQLVPKPFMAGEVIVNAVRAGEKTPLAYSSVTGEMIRKQNLGMDLPFILSLTPSLVETSESGTGIGYTNLRIRGTDASRINVTLDGIPLNDPESQQVFWVDLPDIASSTDNLQVQRGVGTSSNGAGAFGATVSIQTSHPEAEPFALAGFSAGSFGTFRRMVSAGTGLLADKFAFQVRFSGLTSNGFIERTSSDHKSSFISGVFRTGKSLIRANIILGEEKTGIGWEGVPRNMLKTNRRYNPAGEYTDESGNLQYYENETDNYTQDHFQLFYNLRVNSTTSFSSAFHYTYGNGYYEEYKEDKPYKDYGLDNVVIRDDTVKTTDLIRRKWMSNDFYGAVWSLKHDGERMTVSMGGGANYYLGNHYGTIIWMKTAGPAVPDYEWYRNNGNKAEISLFGKTEFAATNSVTVYGDLQFRYINYLMKGLDDDFKDLRQRHEYNFFNPKAGVFWTLSPSQDAYLSFAIANREPTRSDFKEASGDPESMPQPERLYDTELGYKLKLSKLTAAANLYAMVYKDQLVPTGELSNVGYSIMTNVRNSYRIGIELNAKWQPVYFMQWDLGLTLSRNRIADFVEYYTDYDTITWEGEYKSTDLGTVDISYSPGVLGTSDLQFRLFRNIGLHLISKYVGKQYFDNTMSDDRMIDPYFVNNVRIDFNPSIPKLKGAGFQLLVNNLFNTRYESNAYGWNWFEAGREKTEAFFFPQAGINFMIKAELKF